MEPSEIIIFGAGPAGLSAAATLAAQGHRVVVYEQRTTAGGAVHRQPTGGAAPLAASRHDRQRWLALAAALAHPNIEIRYQVAFTGLDADGYLLAEDRAQGRALKLRARAVIFALGALEMVRPVPGWELAGVATAGGLQVMMKETGLAPRGDVLLAGSGPLMVVLAAQMARLGNAPKAVIEWGNPMAPAAGLRLLARQPGVVVQGLGPLLRVLTSPARYLRGAELLSITRKDDRLLAQVRTASGVQEIAADHIGLHHGIRANDFGLPLENLCPPKGHPLVLRAGDCKDALGADAAVASGKDQATRLMAALAGQTQPLAPCEVLARQRRAQAALWQSFAPARPPRALADLPDETLLCRCERRTVGDLKTLIAREDQLGPREIKHNGRFGMGACQGRFCAHNTLDLLAELRNTPAAAPDQLTGRRWPARPVSIASLLEAPVVSQD